MDNTLSVGDYESAEVKLESVHDPVSYIYSSKNIDTELHSDENVNITLRSET